MYPEASHFGGIMWPPQTKGILALMDLDEVMGLETDICDDIDMLCQPHCLDDTLYFRVLKTQPRAWETVPVSLAASTRLGQSAMCL